MLESLSGTITPTGGKFSNACGGSGEGSDVLNACLKGVSFDKAPCGEEKTRGSSWKQKKWHDH